MPGDDWQRFANLRLLYAYQYATPGKKLLFMGAELAQWREWDHESQLDWGLVGSPLHDGVGTLIKDLNRLHAEVSALHDLDVEASGFAWTQPNEPDSGLLSFLRFGSTGHPLLVTCNVTPVVRLNVLAGVPCEGEWIELFNSDAREYGGSGAGNLGGAATHPLPNHGMPYTLTLTVPPLACLFLQPR
jgi:1,4-alpha-glucan branching enzyme